MKLRALLIASFAACPLPARAAMWPGEDWTPASPESQGMSSRALEEAAQYALRSGGGSGCVIRLGFLVKEWGDPGKLADIKSATKGAVGASLLGLAIDDGLVRLDDKARTHSPGLGAEKPENVATGWLDEISVRHLATMTAGFDDGRPPRLVRRPGSGGEYSNDTSNMLAELLTLRFGEDLRAVLERRIMAPIGVSPAEWAWRENSYRPKKVGGLASREFASGITATHRALARIGYLYLREGEWSGKRILSREYIRLATTPTDLPSFVPYYAFYWGSNRRGTYPEIPVDTFWALGLGDSLIAVCPSLDIVTVRLGTGSARSQLPGGDAPDDWGKRVAGFFRLVAAAAEGPPSSAAPERASRPPCPPSPAIAGLRWAPESAIRRAAQGSDNWPLTWADDGHLYAAYGDGRGFEPFLPEKLSLGLARIAGEPDRFSGENLRAPTLEQTGEGAQGMKASGLLMVDGALYLLARNAGNSRLAWSSDRGKTWTWADWKFTTSFGCPTFLNSGRNNAGARDGFVYVYSPDSDSAYAPSDRMVLARAPADRIRDRGAYEFLESVEPGNRPRWTRDIDRRGAVFTHPGRCYRSGITYCAGLKRYLWCQTLPGGDARSAGGFGIYDAPEPWGPWTTVFFTESWDVGPGETCSFPAKWMSLDGKTLHLVFSGGDSFSVRRVELEIAGDAKGSLRLSPLLADSGGKPIDSAEGWARRRAELKSQWHEFMGRFPAAKAPLHSELGEPEKLEGFTRRKVRYQIEEGVFTDGYLLEPAGPAEKLPAVVVFHPTIATHTAQTAGVDASAPEKMLGVHLARRGYAALCPRCFIFDDGDSYVGHVRRMKERHPDWTGMARMAWDGVRAVDFLESLPEVDRDRIGAMGHSLGAKETLFAAAFDDRIRAAVFSEGGIGLEFSNWHDVWYLGPGIRAPGFPLENHQLLAIIAPRAFLLLAGGKDGADNERSGEFIEAARPVYRLLGAEANIDWLAHGQGHRIPAEARRAAEEFLDRHLKR